MFCKSAVIYAICLCVSNIIQLITTHQNAAWVLNSQTDPRHKGIFSSLSGSSTLAKVLQKWYTSQQRNLTLQVRDHEIVAEDISKSHFFCCKPYQANVNRNPVTAPVCKISRLNDTWACLQCVYFPVIYATAFSMLCILAHASAKTKMFEGFKLCSFYWSFSSDIVAVKGLTLLK